LDEPINHLDIPSRERFEQGLARIKGTALGVVHHRHFVGRLATAMWAIEKRTSRRYADLEDLRRAKSRDSSAT
jgi:ATP-binding cassette subfamily F protein 3